jgi:hypothetical protein
MWVLSNKEACVFLVCEFLHDVKMAQLFYCCKYYRQNKTNIKLRSGYREKSQNTFTVSLLAVQDQVLLRIGVAVTSMAFNH